MSIFTKRGRPTITMFGEALSTFVCQRLANVIIHKYAKFEPNAPHGLRIMSIFTKRAPKMMLGEASSPISIPVLGQC